MRPGLPRGEFLLMALAAAGHHAQHVGRAQHHAFRRGVAQMRHHAAYVAGNAALMALRAGHVAMRGRLPQLDIAPDLVAARARGAIAAMIIMVGARKMAAATSKNPRRRQPARRTSARFTSASPFPATSQNARRRVIRDGHDGQRRIEPAVGDVNAAIHHKDVVQVVNLAMAIHHRRPGIVPMRQVPA